MKKLSLLFAALLLCSVGGCVLSLHPIYTDADVVFEPALLGVWSQAGSGELWKFEKSDSVSYTVVYTDKDGKAGRLKAHLAKVGESMFLDFYPEQPEMPYSDFYMLHLLPVHTFALVEAITPNLTLASMNIDWLKKYLEDNPHEVRYEIADDKLVFTASPKELQAFAIKYLKTPDAYDEPTVLEPVKVK